MSFTLPAVGNCDFCRSPITAENPGFSHDLIHSAHKACLWTLVNNKALLNQSAKCLCDRNIEQIGMDQVPPPALNSTRFEQRFDPNLKMNRFNVSERPSIYRMILSLLPDRNNGTLNRWFRSDEERGMVAEMVANIRLTPALAPVLDSILATGPIPLESRMQGMKYAIQNGQVPALNALIQGNAENHSLAIKCAIQLNNELILQAIIKTPEQRAIALQYAVEENNLEMVNWVISSGNFTEANILKPLLFAAKQGFTDICTRLVQSPNAQTATNRRSSALMAACSYHQTETIRAIRELGDMTPLSAKGCMANILSRSIEVSNEDAQMFQFPVFTALIGNDPHLRGVGVEIASCSNKPILAALLLTTGPIPDSSRLNSILSAIPFRDIEFLSLLIQTEEQRSFAVKAAQQLQNQELVDALNALQI